MLTLKRLDIENANMLIAFERMVGGIGVRSGSPAQDLEVAQTGVAAFSEVQRQKV